MSSEPSITLYTDQTPNGVKLSITLEELGVPYNVHHLPISKNTQKEPWFLKINPNGRIPALTDTYTDGEPIRVFESGSCQLYLISRYDPSYRVSFPPGTREYVEMLNWLFFQNAGVGPMQGQSNHFVRYAPEKIEYAQNRYMNETRRLYSVLEEQLNSNGAQGYIVADGGKCTIADIAIYGWVAASGWAGVDIDKFPNLKAWEARMAAREGVKRGRDVPTKQNYHKNMSEEEMAREAKKASDWVLKGMQEDAQKHS